jgi:sortase A
VRGRLPVTSSGQALAETTATGHVYARTRAQRVRHAAGLVLLVLGILGLTWTVVVWQWQDPFTALYTKWEQRGLARQYHRLDTTWHAPAAAGTQTTDARRRIALDAASYRRETHTGEAIGKIVIGRIGLDMTLVDGTDESSLTRGPGRDLRTYMPGQNRLVYIAGHRTTYLAPFADINDIRPGDYITISVPYGTFTYRAFRHTIVPATDLAMLRSPQHELLRLQACHPRFFATHRYIVDARLVRVQPRSGAAYRLTR